MPNCYFIHSEGVSEFFQCVSTDRERGNCPAFSGVVCLLAGSGYRASTGLPTPWCPTKIMQEEDWTFVSLCPPFLYLCCLFLAFPSRRALISCLLRALSLTLLVMTSSLGKSNVGCSVLHHSIACQLRDFTRWYVKCFPLNVSQDYYTYKVLSMYF